MSDQKDAALREADECPERKESWQKFLRERLEIPEGHEKYVASGFSLRDMWTAHAHGFHFAYDRAVSERDEAREKLKQIELHRDNDILIEKQSIEEIYQLRAENAKLRELVGKAEEILSDYQSPRWVLAKKECGL